MVLVVVHRATGNELLVEHNWIGEVPREGDHVELHSGPETRWVVDEVDWVFADAPADAHDDVPLKRLRVMVVDEEEYERKVHKIGATAEIRDAICSGCGHPKSLHAEAHCTGRSGTCECGGFKP